MTCDQAKQSLMLLAYDELDEESQGELELHLHHCPECEAELAALKALPERMEWESLPVVSPNLLAASRMRLDDALDQAGHGMWGIRVRAALLHAWRHVYAAPALATLLVGIGFLSGNLLTRYQFHRTQAASGATVTLTNDAESTIGAISGVYSTPDPNTVQVKYNRIVPTTFQGSVDNPLMRQLLMIGAQKGINNEVRVTSVGFLADECLAGRRCEHATEGKGAGLRDALLVSLRYDKNPTVRLKALAGLQRFVAEDPKVRDAVLESLSSDPNAQVRQHAIAMLTPVQGDSSVRRVLHTVSTQDENPYIRTASMQALGSVDDLQ